MFEFAKMTKAVVIDLGTVEKIESAKESHFGDSFFEIFFSDSPDVAEVEVFELRQTAQITHSSSGVGTLTQIQVVKVDEFSNVITEILLIEAQGVSPNETTERGS